MDRESLDDLLTRVAARAHRYLTEVDELPAGGVSLAQRLAAQIRESGDFELLAEPRLNVVCFRYRPPGLSESDLDELNRRLGQAIIDNGRVYFGSTVYAGKVAFRPAISNWRTTEPDVDVILPVTRELAVRLRRQVQA